MTATAALLTKSSTGKSDKADSQTTATSGSFVSHYRKSGRVHYFELYFPSMSTEDELFATQAELLKRGVALLDDRIRRLSPQEEDKFTISDRASVITIFQTRSVLVFRDTLNFLADEIITPDANKRAFFLLPHSRTLLDIYARFLHLLINCPDEDNRALTCIAYQMLGAKSLSGSTAYDEALKVYGTFLDSVKPDFPKDPIALKYSWIVKNGLAFANRDELLTPENMKRFSDYSLEVFGTENAYFIYSSISEFLHGNPYYYRGTEHNERYWVTSTALITTAFFVELIDRYILDVQPRDFREWLAEIKSTTGEYTRFWYTKRMAMLAEQKERGDIFSE